MATVFERWSQTLDELKARKAKPQEVESARSELRRKFEEKAKESGLDDTARAVALTRFETGTQALSVKKGLVKEPDILSDEERFAVNHPVIGGIMQAGKELVAPLAQGTQRIVGGAARLLNDIGDNDKGTVLDRIATSMDDAQKSVDEFAGEGYAKADGVRGFAKSAVQNAPQLALSFIPGAALGRAASLAKAAKGAKASANVLKYGTPIAAGLSFGQNFAGEYGDARQQTEQKLAEATPDDLRNSKEYGDEFSKLERDFYDKGMSVDDAAVAARDYLVDSIAEKRANVAATANTALEFIAPGAMAVMPGRKAAAAAKSLALAGKTAGGGRLGNKAANLSDLKDVGKQFLQEAAQGGVTERVAEGARANAFNDNVDYGSVAKSAMIEGLAGGIMGGGMQMAAGGTSRRLANDAVKDATSQRERYANAASQADAMAADIRASSAGREMTEDESVALADAELSAKTAKDMVAKIDAALGRPVDPQPTPNDGQQSAMDELRAAADESAPQSEPQPSQQPSPQPATGLSGVVGRAQASAAPDITSTIDDHIAAGQTPDFAALAQAAKRDRSEVVDLFNRRRTLADMAEAGDLTGMREMAGRMTADPAEQDSIIEQAVAIRDKRRNLSVQAQQQPQQAVPQPVSDPQDPEQAKYAKTYQKALNEAVAALESGKSDVDAFLPLNRQYKGKLNDSDLSGLIDSAKQSIGEKQAATKARNDAISTAAQHVAAGDEISAVTALADAGITDDAEIQAALKEAKGLTRETGKQEKQPAAQPQKPASTPMEQAVDVALRTTRAGNQVKLGALAKKFGVGMADLAVSIAKAKKAALNTKQPEKPREILALPAPKDEPVSADQPLVARRGQVMPKAQADALSDISTREKRDMRRAMAEEAGNPTGVPSSLRPRVESPARAPQKAALPDVILRNDGKPFANEVQAERVLKRKAAADTHEVAPAPEGNGVIIKAKRKGPSTAIDVEKDDILAAIAKAGGVDWEQARAQGGFDPAESGRRGSGIMRVFKKNGGMPLNRMAETLSQYGYPVTEGDGNYSVNALLDAMDAAMRGGKVGTPQFNERLAREAYEREAEMRSIDDALDNTSSDMPSWLDDGVDNMISAADESDAVVAAIADVLSEAENEQSTGPVAGAGQETDAGAAPRGGEGSRAPTAEVRSGGQRESQADTGQGPEDAGRDGNGEENWIGADRYFNETLDSEYGPGNSKSEAAAFARTAAPGTTILETIIRPSGKKTHLLHLVGADGDRQTEFVREGDTLDSVLPAMREKLKRSEESLAQMKEKSSREADANKEIAKRNGFVVGKRLGDITPNTGKLLRSAVIIADHGNGVFDVQGTAGNKQAVISGMTAASIERAVARANGEDSFSLTTQTEAERLAEERRQAAAVEAERKADEQARQKAEADRDIKSFTLTGSDRPADVAVAAGQNDLVGPKTRGEKEAERKDEERKQAEADKAHAEAVDAAKYLKDIVYSLEILVGNNKPLLINLSSKLGKSGRDSILMNALGITREQAHDINNRLDDRMPHKLRAVDMQDAYERFPALKRIIDDAEVEVRVSEEARKARSEQKDQEQKTAPEPQAVEARTEPVKWFSTREKAEERAKKIKKVSGEDYHVVQTAKGRFELHPGNGETPFKINKQGLPARKRIGVNYRGESLYEDEKGVRSYAVDGFLVTESVSIVPGRGFERGELTKEYKTTEELAAENAKPPAPSKNNDDLSAMFDDVVSQVASERTAAQAAVSAAKNVGMSLGDAIDGLGKLFGGGGKLSSGLTFDSETYAKAKPYFISAVSHLKNAAADIREAMVAVVRMVSEKFGQDAVMQMKPYVVQFISDVRDGKIDLAGATLNESDTTGENGNDVRKLDTTGQGALEGVPAGAAQGSGKGRGTGSGTAEGSGADGGADERVAGARGDGNGSVGDSQERVAVSGAGTGGRGRRGSGSSAGAGRKVSAEPASGNEQVGSVSGQSGGLTGSDSSQPNMALEPGRIDPPQLPDDFIVQEDFALGEGGQRTKYKQNVEAIKLVKALDAEGRTATTEEQKVIAKYVGWGGIPQAFDPDNKDWTAQHSELKSLLSDDEWDAAFESTQYAHYTSREIIGGMYDAVRRLGFTGGNVLEAGGGVGNFIGLMPVDLRTSGKVTLIERETIAASIAKHLYPRQNVRAEDFTEFGKGQDGQFDMQIGNPPFSSNPLTDKSGRKHLTGLSVHNYFITKGVDMLREGGVLVVVVSNSFLDAGNTRAREYIAKRAKLLGAIRLPNNAFSKNANTQVTTDIIFLQKLPESQWGSKAATDDGKRWVEVGRVRDPNGKGELPLNHYFIANPSMMLGSWGSHGTMYRPDSPALVARPGQDTAALLKQAITKLPEGVYAPASVGRTQAMQGALLEKLHDKTVDENGFYVNSGKLWRRVADAAGEEYAVEITPSTVITGTQPIGQPGVDRLKQLAEIRRVMRSLLAAETEDRKSDMDSLRAELNKRYDDYVKDNGRINDPTTKRLMRDDPDYPLISALEMDYEPGIGPTAAKKAGIKTQKSKAKKAAIFDQRVIEARKAVTKADSPQDAINISMAERGRIDAEYIGKLLGIPAEDVLGQLSSGQSPLLFRDPATGEYVLRDAYLSGNVREKLRQAKEAGLMSNARALEEVQPADIPASQISVRIGSPWVPVSVYADFARHLFGEGTKASLRYVKANSSFNGVIVPGSEPMASNKYGIQDYHGDALLLAMMNNRQIKVTFRDSDGKTYVDKDLTDQANAKAEEIKQAFQDWIFKDSDRAESLVRAYNDANNNYVVRQYDGAWLKFPGKVPDSVIRFRRHQRNAIARTIQDRTTLYDHVVGAGKTFTAIASAMEMKRMGLVRKPMMIVPNHLVGQWASDFYRLYPGAKILAATKRDFERENRRNFLAKIASGDWDAVIIAHSSFERIRPSPEFEERFTQAEIDRIMREAEEVEMSLGDEKEKKRTVKQLAAIQERLENRIARLRDKPMDDLLDFQQIGVDQLFVDEAHLFKNLMFTTKMQGVTGLGDGSGSQRAYDMYLKTNQVMDQNGRGQGVVFMTGTPVSNSLAEMYHMMRYLMPTQMRQLGFESFDAWANTYASVNQVWMQTSGGDGFKAQNRMSNFDNVPELLKLFDQVSDTVTMDDIKAAFKEETGKDFPLPKLATGRRQPVSLEKTPAQEAYMQDIIRRLKEVEARKGPPMKGQDNHLSIMSDARKAAMDIRLVDRNVIEREKGARVDRASNEIYDRWKKYDAERGTQLVFADLGTPVTSVKDEVKEYDAIMARITAGENPDTITMAQLGDEDAAAKVSDAEAARDELDAKGRDWLTSIEGAKRGFSVYDDLRKALVEKGIPEAQIAFIHDYKTDDQKVGLFKKVNSGEIRILMGSTAKMGAGTNVQKRLVALHHLDVPWKPSDLEQREGRIIRQGNELADKNPNFEVEILAYVTKDTLDMRMWQIQEVKLKMINQLRTRQIERELENAFEEMEMSAGEMQAAATGNMDLLREIQLRSEVQKLEKKQRAFDASKSDALSGIRRAKAEIGRIPESIASYERMTEASTDVLRQVFEERNRFDATINGKKYTNHTEAAKVLRDMIDAVETGEDGKERKAKLDVNLNGEQHTNRQKLAEAFVRLTGDAEPFMFDAGDGKVFRLDDAAEATMDTIASSRESDGEKMLGNMGDFKVSVEYAGKKFDQDDMYEVHATLGEDSLPSAVVRSKPGDDRATARSILRTVRDMLRDVQPALSSLKASLARAQKNLSELEKIDTTSEWPDSARLERLRAEHRALREKMSKGEGEDGNAKKFSTSPSVSAPGLTPASAREILAADPVLSKALPYIDIKNSADSVPDGATPIGEEGYYHNGRITLFADNIRAFPPAQLTAEERLKWVAFHEVTHRGIANLADSETYLSELGRAAKHPFVKNLAKKIYEHRQTLDPKYHVSMEVATEEALAEINAALRTGNVKQIKEQYGLHFPLSIRPRVRSAVSRFFESMKRIIKKVFGRGLTDEQLEGLLGRVTEAGVGPGPGKKADGVRYSTGPMDWLNEQGRIAKQYFSKETASLDLTFWQKTLGTQLNTALKNPAFKKVYDLTQRLIQHVNNDAYDSINAAPDVLSRLEDWKDYKRDLISTGKEIGAAVTMRQSKRQKDMQAAAEVLFEGTRFDKKVYSDKELDGFGLTADQKEIYRQARAAIDKSIGNAGKSQAINVAMNAKAVNWYTMERLINADMEPDALFAELRDLIDARVADARNEIAAGASPDRQEALEKKIATWEQAATAVGEIEGIVNKSVTEGYAPLMRWGRYTVSVIDPATKKTLRFHMLESKREQAALTVNLQDKYGAANVVPGVMNEERFKQFKGITPETMALFASVTGMDQDAAYQEYLKLAVPGRSALKRKIHRKGDNGEGIEGFSTDLPRVLSSFVLSNARKSARDLYRGRIDDAVESIPGNAGGVKEQAIKLGQFVLEPDENDWSVGIRNMLFVWNMGGSIAFGALNLSQPWMMTLPWLSQFSDPASAAGIMGKATKIAASAQMSGKAPKGYEAEYERAMREGIVDPQNVFMLQGVERGQSGVTANVWRNIAHGMGMIASATESMNRKLTLIAALDVARSKGDAWLKSKGFADAYDLAARAVAETQGIYNKGNRPAWARNPLGAVLLVFKQYSINWVEMAQRMAMNHYGDDKYRKGLWMLIGMLFMMAGGMGLPIVRDIFDLIETGMSASGRPVNIERQMQMALGKDLYEPLMYGPINSFLLNPMGADMHGNMSMGNMIPATASLNSGMSKTARGDEAMEVFGAGTGLVSKFVDAYDQASAGNLGDAMIAASPRAVASIAKSVEMATSGKYTDSKGRTVRTVTPAEALIKGLDLQPASVARIQRERSLRFEDEAIQSQAKTEIRNDLIAAYESGDRKEIDAAEARLDEWNRNNPLYPVEINRRGLRKTIRERGKSWSARDEAPKGMEWMDEWIPEK